jgi:hypothetical protein
LSESTPEAEPSAGISPEDAFLGFLTCGDRESIPLSLESLLDALKRRLARRRDVWGEAGVPVRDFRKKEEAGSWSTS